MSPFQLLSLMFTSLVGTVDCENLRKLESIDHQRKSLTDKMCPSLRNSSLLTEANPHRGIVMCGADKFLSDVKKMIYQNRYLWCSSLQFVIAHCDEISEANQQQLRAMDPSIRFMNLCSPAPGQKTFPSNAKDRFHGFFCKVGALIASPFEETMFVDVDVVWFKQPDRLFESPYYKKTGLLLFRDRSFYPVTGSTADDKAKRYREVTSFFKQHGVSLDLASSKRRAEENSVNLFWLHMWRLLRGDGSETFPVDFGESSVVILNKRNHQKTLTVMEDLLPSFGVGYGDKEIYWMAATIADEPYSFSPYLAGQFGDCSGPVFHYDPDEPVDTVTAFYANAGLIVDELRFVGDHFHHVMTSPVRASVNDPRSVIDYRWFYTPQTTIEDELIKKYSCACQNLECGSIPDHMYRHLLLMQWLSLTMKMDASRAPSESVCVPVYIPWLDRLEKVFFENITTKAFCHRIGCPHLPLKVNATLPWTEARLGFAKNKYCEPVYFSAHAVTNDNGTSSSGDSSDAAMMMMMMMAERATRARTPYSEWGGNNRNDPSEKKNKATPPAIFKSVGAPSKALPRSISVVRSTSTSSAAGKLAPPPPPPPPPPSKSSKPPPQHHSHHQGNTGGTGTASGSSSSVDSKVGHLRQHANSNSNAKNSKNIGGDQRSSSSSSISSSSSSSDSSTPKQGKKKREGEEEQEGQGNDKEKSEKHTASKHEEDTNENKREEEKHDTTDKEKDRDRDEEK